MDPRAGSRLREEVNRFKPHVVMHQVRTVEDIQIGFAMRKVCRRYFGIDVDYLGYVNYDNAVWKSVRRRCLLLTEYPLSEPVEFLGRRVGEYSRRELSQRVAVVPQATGTVFPYTAGEIVAMGRYPHLRWPGWMMNRPCLGRCVAFGGNRWCASSGVIWHAGHLWLRRWRI